LFPGGNPSSSILTNPTVIYDTIGFYKVTLIATFQNGTDTFTIDSLIEVSLPNQSISSGYWSNPLIWRCGVIPGLNDSVVIISGHNVVYDGSTQVRKLTVEENASLSFTDPYSLLTVGFDSLRNCTIIWQEI
jgi:PKD repeat protein